MLSILNSPIVLAIILILGLVFLVKGADWLVDGASALAKRFGISDLAIGLTIVAFGTSMPEFVVNIVSVADEATDLAITNILGSNIINTFVILGLTAIVYPVVSQKHSRKFDLPMSILASIMVLVLVIFHSPFSPDETGISRLGGIMLIIVFAIFLSVTILYGINHPDEASAEIKQVSVLKAVILVLIGLLLLVVGGEMIVKSAVKIAVRLGVGEAIIGLTIVALGTSLPELATSVVAATKKNSDIAFGNVIGSNIFNVFLVLGVSAVIHPLPAYSGITLDACVAALGSVLVLLLVISNHNKEIKRYGGAILLLIYVAYLTYRLLTI